MNSRRRGRPFVGYLAVAAVVALSTTGGWAIASSGGGSIHACANKHTGALRLAGRCTKRERAVSWNAVGPRGPGGPQGLPGAPGQTRNTGPAGPYTTTLPSGQTERGVFAAESDDLGNSGAHTDAPISFPVALASAPSVQVVPGAPTTQCPGSTSAPTATAGYLCIYVFASGGTISEFDPATATANAASKWGVNLSVVSSQYAYAFGSWAVRAP
ncbi:MAG: hypothetical protein QOF83_1207 [Solirubrobacteraceae bacterium]|nr:hypothetical protein [Solirubrobacteraceae bacterium]